MPSKALPILGILMAAWVMVIPLQADDSINPDPNDDLTNWHGDGESAYLKADGSEGSETDPNATPVTKLTLSHGQSRVVYREIDLRGNSYAVHVQIDLYASKDFQRSKFASDYTVTERYKTMWEDDIYSPDVDFWIRMGPGLQYFGWFYTTFGLKPGSWQTLKASWDQGQKPGERFTVNFCVPPGDGAVYLKNPVVSP